NRAQNRPEHSHRAWCASLGVGIEHGLAVRGADLAKLHPADHRQHVLAHVALVLRPDPWPRMTLGVGVIEPALSKRLAADLRWNRVVADVETAERSAQRSRNRTPTVAGASASQARGRRRRRNTTTFRACGHVPSSTLRLPASAPLALALGICAPVGAEQDTR